MRPTWRATLGAAAAAVLVTTVAPSTALGLTSPPGTGDRRPIVGSAAAAAADGGPAVTVTLVTGDVVLVSGAGTDHASATLLPRPDGTVPVAEIRRVGRAIYVLPAEAAGVIAGGRVDEELFNVTGLVTQGYDDASTQTLPVIASYSGKVNLAKAAPATPRGADRGVTMRSIKAVAFQADKAKARSFWADVTSRSSAAGAQLQKLWLDSMVSATLDQSTAQVNAPQAWAAGLTGSGTEVAVLDTGADAGHPDLAGRIVASQDFTGSAGGALSDLNGHGTHTASTVGGSGAASDGAERGVAPDTQLLIGKVLNDSGAGSTSGIVAGMEWAVEQGADVISMSLGNSGAPGDCTDPMAAAAQQLSTSSTSLFVIAAGNAGPGNNTVSTPGCAPAALTVGAVDSADAPAWFSSRGPAAYTHTLKPEIAAPGVAISAARSGGRGADAYVSMSGTSMATPHVAGAAAVLKQAHPGWTGAQLKAALVSSADSAIPGDVRESGGGRLDVAAATTQEVTAPVVQTGSFPWPHTSAQATTVQVPYTNHTDTAQTLSLSVAGVTGDDGSALKISPVTVGASTITIPAGETVSLPIQVNPAVKLSAAQYGDITGRIVATGTNAHVTVSTPFALYDAPQTVNLTVRMVDRLGKPASGASSLDVVNIDSTKGQRSYNNGASEQVIPVRPGTYLVSGFVLTPDALGDRPVLDSVTYEARPQLEIKADTTLVLDARTAHRLDVKTDRTSEAGTTVLAFERTWQDLWTHSGQLVVGSSVTGAYADIQGNPKEGSWEFGLWQRRMAPAVQWMSVGDVSLHPTAPSLTSAGLDGVGTAPLVDAGAGTTADLTADRVGGKVALVRLASASDNLTSSMVSSARSAGAKALLLYRPDAGRWAPSMGFTATAVAAYSLPQAEGQALKAALAAAPDGELSLSWQATARSPFAYNLGFTESTPLTDDKTFVVHDDKLGRTEATYHAMGLDTAFLDYVAATRPSGLSIGVANFTGLPVPGQRTELYTDDGSVWRQSVMSSFPFGEQMVNERRSYPAGSVREETWHDGVIAPTSIHDQDGKEQLTAERQGGLMGFAPEMWGDSYGHVAVPGGFGDLGRMVFKRNGEVIGTSAYPFGVVEVPAEDSLYEVSLMQEKIGQPSRVFLRSTQISTTWTFRSHLEPDVFSRALPLIFPRVDLPEDGMKTLAANGNQQLGLRLTGHAGYAPGAITEAKVATSYDGGATWTDAVVAQSGGQWTATVDHTGASGKPVALRLELTDSQGNKVTQVVQAAYAIR
jgi:hypothetical protein